MPADSEASRGSTAASERVLTERGRRTRSAIVAAAASLMYQQGVAATSVDEILRISGTGKSQLYHYFADRSELVMAVIDHQADKVLAAQPLLFEIESLADIERWLRGLVAAHRAPGGPFGCPLGTMAAELKNDPAYRPAIESAFARWERPLADGLRLMVRHGELGRGDRPDRIASATIAALQGGMLLARLKMDVGPLRDVTAMAVSEIARRVERQAERARLAAVPRGGSSARRR